MEIVLDSVDSSQIHAIGHDPDSNTLAIQFKSRGGPGSVYHYENFTAEQFAEFKASESIGRYFKDNIKNETEKHPFVKASSCEPSGSLEASP